MLSLSSVTSDAVIEMAVGGLRIILSLLLLPARGRSFGNPGMVGERISPQDKQRQVARRARIFASHDERLTLSTTLSLSQPKKG